VPQSQLPHEPSSSSAFIPFSESDLKSGSSAKKDNDRENEHVDGCVVCFSLAQRKKADAMEQIKLVVVGDSAVGKTYALYHGKVLVNQIPKDVSLSRTARTLSPVNMSPQW